MFRRFRRRQEREQLDSEVSHLKAEIRRLETALHDLIAASDDVLVDLRRAQREQTALENRSASGFADAWSSSDSSPSGFEDFFAEDEFDRRARRWLLSSS